MHKTNEIKRAKGLLNQALIVASNSMPRNHSVQEAKAHIKKAINELDVAVKSYVKKKHESESTYQNWWTNIVSATVNQSLANNSPEANVANVKSLSQLNSMIAQEEKNLEELEKKSHEIDDITDILNE